MPYSQTETQYSPVFYVAKFIPFKTICGGICMYDVDTEKCVRCVKSNFR